SPPGPRSSGGSVRGQQTMKNWTLLAGEAQTHELKGTRKMPALLDQGFVCLRLADDRLDKRPTAQELADRETPKTFLFCAVDHHRRCGRQMNHRQAGTPNALLDVFRVRLPGIFEHQPLARETLECRGRCLAFTLRCGMSNGAR